jgi:hypothetical protein
MFPTLRRIVLYLALLGLVISTSASASTTPKPRVIAEIDNWTAAGSRVVFEGSVSPNNPFYYGPGKSGLWLQRFGSRKLELLSTTQICEDPPTYALGAKGTVGCLDSWAMITQIGFDVYVRLGDGTVKKLVSLYFEGGDFDVPVTEGVPAIFGDGNFLGYLDVSGAGVVKLFRITPSGQAVYVADLTGLSSCSPSECGNVVVDSGTVVIHEFGGSEVYVFTTAGKHIATFSANPAGAVAIRKNRIVVLTNEGQLAVYTLHGKLVHSYRVNAIRGQIATYYGYAAYFGRGHKAVHMIKLSSGRDVTIAQAPSWDGNPYSDSLSLQTSGLTVARTGKPSLLYIPMRTIRKKLG